MEDEYKDKQRERSCGRVPLKYRNKRAGSLKTAFCNRMPVEFLRDRCDMSMTFSAENLSGSIVLYFLHSGYLLRGNACHERIAVVNPTAFINEHVHRLPLR